MNTHPHFIKVSTRYIVVSILAATAFFHANAQVVTDETENSESNITTLDNGGITSLPQDSIDYASLEQANQGSAAPVTQWTTGEEVAAVVGAVALVAASYCGYQRYQAAADLRRNNYRPLEGVDDRDNNRDGSITSADTSEQQPRGDGSTGFSGADNQQAPLAVPVRTTYGVTFNFKEQEAIKENVVNNARLDREQKQNLLYSLKHDQNFYSDHWNDIQNLSQLLEGEDLSHLILMFQKSRAFKERKEGELKAVQTSKQALAAQQYNSPFGGDSNITPRITRVVGK